MIKVILVLACGAFAAVADYTAPGLVSEILGGCALACLFGAMFLSRYRVWIERSP